MTPVQRLLLNGSEDQILDTLTPPASHPGPRNPPLAWNPMSEEVYHSYNIAHLAPLDLGVT